MKHASDGVFCGRMIIDLSRQLQAKTVLLSRAGQADADLVFTPFCTVCARCQAIEQLKKCGTCK